MDVIRKCGASLLILLLTTAPTWAQLATAELNGRVTDASGAVLPGATATDFWGIAGNPWQKLPPSIVMTPQDMVDAALVGLDQGELVSIPSLHEGEEWTRFEAARRAISQRFGNSVPAPRYGISLLRSA